MILQQERKKGRKFDLERSKLRPCNCGFFSVTSTLYLHRVKKASHAIQHNSLKTNSRGDRI